MNIDKVGNNLNIFEQTTELNLDISTDSTIDTFKDVTIDLLITSAINQINTNSNQNTIVTPTITEVGGVTTSVSTDGKLASPISKQITSTQVVDDLYLNKTSEDGNTIRLGNLNIKDTP